MMRCFMFTQARTVKLTVSTRMAICAAGMARNTRTSASTHQTANTPRNHPAMTRRGVRP